MANDISPYNPQFWAAEALIQLEKALGMASRVHLGYDEERRSFRRGQVVNIRRPSSFTVGDAPASAQDLDPDNVQVSLDYWKEVKFKLTDKELAFTGAQIIDEHIRPAAVALADYIDQQLALLYKDVPWFVDLQSTTAIADVTGVRKVMFDNKVPLRDVGRVHYMVGGALEQGFLNLSAFTQQQGAGDTGVSSQRSGSLGTKFGLEIFSNQNVQSHTPGTMADSAGALTADAAKGATSISVDGVTAGGTVKKGDTLVIAGNAQRYAITADATESTGITLAITPPLVQDYSDNDVVTIELDAHTANLAFHRNAFALVTAPLSDIGGELGARIAVVNDPITNLALRSRLYYVGNSSEVHVALDVLFGIKTLDPNLACRGRGA